jgi:alcohol dehydrogenase class IV
MLGAPHGELCAGLLPEVMTLNLRALRARARDGPALERYAEVARALTGRPDAMPEEGVSWVRELRERLGIPRLAAQGLTREEIPDVVAKARRASSMRANPVELTEGELEAVLEDAL